jgi:hypothetical protein
MAHHANTLTMLDAVTLMDLDTKRMRFETPLKDQKGTRIPITYDYPSKRNDWLFVALDEIPCAYGFSQPEDPVTKLPSKEWSASLGPAGVKRSKTNPKEFENLPEALIPMYKKQDEVDEVWGAQVSAVKKSARFRFSIRPSQKHEGDPEKHPENQTWHCKLSMDKEKTVVKTNFYSPDMRKMTWEEALSVSAGSRIVPVICYASSWTQSADMATLQMRVNRIVFTAFGRPPGSDVENDFVIYGTVKTSTGDSFVFTKKEDEDEDEAWSQRSAATKPSADLVVAQITGVPDEYKKKMQVAEEEMKNAADFFAPPISAAAAAEPIARKKIKVDGAGA